MSIVHRGDAEEHEYYGLRATRQHLHCVLDGRVRLVRYIGLDVILHGNTAEGYPGIKGIANYGTYNMAAVVYFR